MVYEKEKSDLVVVGGAITGMVAAIKAKETNPDLEVVLVDKGTIAKTGCAYWGGGDIVCVLPEDDMESIRESYLWGGDYLGDTKWLDWVLSETHDRVKEMDKWGVPFEKSEDGTLIRAGGRGGAALSAIGRSKDMLKRLRRHAKRLGVRFMDKVMVTDILLDDDGIASGVIAFKIGTDVYSPCFIEAKAIFLSPGPCRFKAAFIGHRFATGDGIAMAYRKGARVANMEFAVSHNTGPRDFDLSGLGRFVAMGAKFLNVQGEEFMWKYDPKLGNRANTNKLVRGMAMEIRENRGPIYFDFTAISPENLQLAKKITPHTFMVLGKLGLDFTRDKIEWIACFSGNGSGPAGLAIDEQMSTTIPGLFAGGDSATKWHYGASASYTGFQFAWCAFTGYHGGINGANYAMKRTHLASRERSVLEALNHQVSPLERDTGESPHDLICAIQDALIPYEVVILKEEGRLSMGLDEIRGIQEELERVKACDTHDLMKAHEAKNMAIIAEMILSTSIIRTESRGMHFREDYPERDDKNWLKRIFLNCKGGAMNIWTEEAKNLWKS